MTTLFYLFAILFLVYEFMIFGESKKFYEYSKRIQTQTRSKIPLDGLQTTYVFFNLIYFIWMLCGLMTFQWPLFLIFILYSIIPLSKIGHLYKKFNALVSILVLGFIVINHFHLRINILELITQ